jgi:flagellin
MAVAPRQMGGNVKEFGPLILQTGPSKDMETMIVIPRITAESIGVAGLNYLSQSGASHALSAVDSALNDIASVRSKLGAYQNRLEFTGSSLDLQVLNARSSLSRIMDTDMALEMTNYTRLTVISHAAMSILSQANKRPEQILQLI